MYFLDFHIKDIEIHIKLNDNRKKFLAISNPISLNMLGKIYSSLIALSLFHLNIFRMFPWKVKLQFHCCFSKFWVFMFSYLPIWKSSNNRLIMHRVIKQVSKGIRQWQINWCTFPMMIHKITPFVDKWLKRSDTQLKEPTRKNK